ncbi:hypothetical protein K458DRAFT_488363 [Lentithecium fluviatile CBS 122367]|uniref:Uncharacterized protein n=1 Tax=Lentithecium fluviatile CBS 122367 TaxID=1168545 RepID=A0A6G1IWS4_9PLEO|nr:hypothetical protein K458DRAFT_488363 [Lentithecium fluviatile CBS 122367]
MRIEWTEAFALAMILADAYAPCRGSMQRRSGSSASSSGTSVLTVAVAVPPFRRTLEFRATIASLPNSNDRVAWLGMDCLTRRAMGYTIVGSGHKQKKASPIQWRRLQLASICGFLLVALLRTVSDEARHKPSGHRKAERNSQELKGE